jgi:hypothetical protein
MHAENKFGDIIRRLKDKEFLPTLNGIILRYQGRKLEMTEEILENTNRENF